VRRPSCPHLTAGSKSLVTADSPAGAQADRAGGRVGNLRSQIAQLDAQIPSPVAAIEGVISVEQVSEQLKRRSAERAGLEAQLRPARGQDQITKAVTQKALDELGGIAKILPRADPALRSKLHASLG
jgi:hypothetical protein